MFVHTLYVRVIHYSTPFRSLSLYRVVSCKYTLKRILRYTVRNTELITIKRAPLRIGYKPVYMARHNSQVITFISSDSEYNLYGNFCVYRKGVSIQYKL